MAAIGRIKSPSSARCLSPPHLPRKSTAFGLIALNRSMTVAAVALPMPKLIIVMSSAVALGIGLSLPTTGTRCHCAKSRT